MSIITIQKDTISDFLEQKLIDHFQQKKDFIRSTRLKSHIILLELEQGRILAYSSRSDKNINYAHYESIVYSIAKSINELIEESFTSAPNVLIYTDSMNRHIFSLPGVVLNDYLLNPSYRDSTGVIENSDLYNDLMNDKNIRPYVHDYFSSENYNSDFPFEGFVGNVERFLSLSWDKVVKADEIVKNLEKVFFDFSVEVLGGTSSELKNKNQIDIFMRVIKGDKNFYLHPSKINTLIIKRKEYKIASSFAFELFLFHHDANHYTDNDLSLITSQVDTLITEADRRLSGDFWTPKIWADRAHKSIEEQLGKNWKEKYTVWDCAAGVLNLTRDYKFSNLYSSTLFSEELEIAEDYNKESIKFQYDFLNDDIDIHLFSREDFKHDDSLFSAFKIPESLLRDMYANKPLVFFSNPPYGAASTKEGSTKTGVNITAIQKHMKSIGGYGHATQELYTQFVYRVQQFAKIFGYTQDFHFFFFFNKGFLLSPAYSKLVNELLEQFTFKDGFMINAGEFGGTSTLWGLIFAHFAIEPHNNKKQESFIFSVEKSIKRKNGTEIKKIGDWTGIRVEKENKLSSWLKEIPVTGVFDTSVPVTKNGFDEPTATTVIKPRNNSIGYALVSGDDVQSYDKYIGLYTLPVARGGGREIEKDNFMRTMVTFAIKRATQKDLQNRGELWVKNKDIFQYPPHNILTQEFFADCLVYSLFDKQSRQTSIRGYEYRGKKYHVYNQFFPFSRGFMMELADSVGNGSLLLDAQVDDVLMGCNVFGESDERLGFLMIEDYRSFMSVEASSVLSEFESLVIDSIGMRESYSIVNPRYQVNNWDAGWLQLNRMIFTDERLDNTVFHRKDEWDYHYSTLREKIANIVYDSGVLPPPICY